MKESILSFGRRLGALQTNPLFLKEREVVLLYGESLISTVKDSSPTRYVSKYPLKCLFAIVPNYKTIYNSLHFE